MQKPDDIYYFENNTFEVHYPNMTVYGSVGVSTTTVIESGPDVWGKRKYFQKCDLYIHEVDWINNETPPAYGRCAELCALWGDLLPLENKVREEYQ